MPRLYCCPFHDDTNASLAVYDNNTYHCFGCGKSGKVNDHVLGQIDHSTEYTAPKVHRKDYNGLTNKGLDFLESRNISAKQAVRYGVQEKPGHSLLFPIYDLTGKTTGSLIRYLNNQKMKYKVLPNNGRYPAYGNVFIDNKADRIYIVESIIDALSLYSREYIPSFVLLGTEIIPELVFILTTLNRYVMVYFDPDAYLKAYIIRDMLKHNYNIEAEVIENGRKPYE